VILGSDAPIEPLDPLSSIGAAVHRTLDDREPWRQGQCVPVADAVSGHTAAAAYALGDERWRGCLLPGYAADLVVLDTDIMSNPERIGSAGVVATMLDGRWVHGAPPW
jgi:predicted amidohydrolase YtcJ